jgi:hypothetical protein
MKCDNYSGLVAYEFRLLLDHLYDRRWYDIEGISQWLIEKMTVGMNRIQRIFLLKVAYQLVDFMNLKLYKNEYEPMYQLLESCETFEEKLAGIHLLHKLRLRNVLPENIYERVYLKNPCAAVQLVHFS